MPTSTSCSSRLTESPSQPPRPQLLVSVRNEAEARLAQESGVEWIDLKEPRAGALGAPTLATAALVAAELEHSTAGMSVAGGELQHCSAPSLGRLAELFPYVKLGTAGMAGDPDWPSQLRQLDRSFAGHARLVPVLYGDFARCDAPGPDQILQVATELRAGYLLIDTFNKDGSTILDYLQLEQLRVLIERANQFGCRVVLAGSVGEAQLPELLSLPVAAIGVRGAVCEGGRDGSMSAAKLSRWVATVQSP